MHKDPQSNEKIYLVSSTDREIVSFVVPARPRRKQANVKRPRASAAVMLHPSRTAMAVFNNVIT